MASIQQNRIVRFLMVLVAVVLTILIYASYYSNPVLTVPTRMHSSAALISTSADEEQQQNAIEIGKNTNSNLIVVVDRQNSKRFQANYVSDQDTNASYAQQYLDIGAQYLPSVAAGSQSKSVEIAGNIKNSTTPATSTTKNSSISPSVNKPNNVTSSVVPSIIRSSPSSSSSLSSSVASHPILAASSSSSSTSQQHKPSTASQGGGDPLDPSKGIPTASIYESGHLDTSPQLCPEEGDSLRLLIVITSAPSHREARLAIRQTWGHYGVRRDVAIAFILGRTTNPSVEDSLSAENYMYGDLIRGHFIDSYNNLTLKTISVLEWVDKNCPHATYVLKTDDDMFINVPKLLSFIEKHHNDKRTIYGRLAKKWKPIRNKKSKYYVSPGQFGQTIFPQFTTGPAYLMSADIIHDLYVKALEQTYLKLEDVFTTGIVAQLLNIKRVHVNEFLNRRIAFNPCNIRKAISVHMIKSNEQFDLWKKLLDMTTKCK